MFPFSMFPYAMLTAPPVCFTSPTFNDIFLLWSGAIGYIQISRYPRKGAKEPKMIENSDYVKNNWKIEPLVYIFFGLLHVEVYSSIKYIENFLNSSSTSLFGIFRISNKKGPFFNVTHLTLYTHFKSQDFKIYPNKEWHIL